MVNLCCGCPRWTIAGSCEPLVYDYLVEYLNVDLLLSCLRLVYSSWNKRIVCICAKNHVNNVLHLCIMLPWQLINIMNAKFIYLFCNKTLLVIFFCFVNLNFTNLFLDFNLLHSIFNLDIFHFLSFWTIFKLQKNFFKKYHLSNFFILWLSMMGLYYPVIWKRSVVHFFFYGVLKLS